MKFFCFIVSLLLLFSCKKDVGKINYGNYPAEVGKIIANNCATAGCHNNASYLSSAGLNLTSWVSMFGGSSSGSPVIPFSSKFSSLCYFINTYSELGIQNVPTMPLNKKALSKDDVKLIYNWIDAGAPDVNGNVMWADNPQRKKLYVANQGCDVVTVIDAETQLPMRYISVGNKASIESPHQIRVSPDGQYWYVNFINNNILQKYRCSDDSYVGDIPLTPLAAGTGTDDAFYWNTFNISNDSKKAYCVSFNQNGVVCAVDLVNRKLIHYLGGLTNPHGILLSKDNTSLYVTAQYGNYITEFDTAFTTYSKYSLTNDPPLDNTNPLNLHDIIQSPNANEIVITCQFTNELRVFNTLTHSVTAVVPTGLNPQEVLYSPSSNSYFISCMDDSLLFPRSYGVVTKINASNFAVKNIACGYQPHGIGLDENKKLLYVLSRNVTDAGPTPHHTSVCGGRNGFMNFIDLNSFTLLNKKYELSVDPYFIAPRP